MSLSCACRVSLLRLRRAMLRAAAAFALCRRRVLSCRAAALLRASAALRQGYVHNCAHDRVMVQFSRCALLATRRFSPILMLWITDNEQGVAVAVGVDCAARHGVARSACSVRHGAAVGSRLARACSC